MGRHTPYNAAHTRAGCAGGWPPYALQRRPHAGQIDFGLHLQVPVGDAPGLAGRLAVAPAGEPVAVDVVCLRVDDPVLGNLDALVEGELQLAVVLGIGRGEDLDEEIGNADVGSYLPDPPVRCLSEFFSESVDCDQ